MSKKILVLCGSSRKDGNTEILADAFIKGAESSGNQVEKITLCRLKIEPCLDCKYCYRNKGKCVLKDDMEMIYEKLMEAELLVIASPVYFYNFPAKLKAVFDRLHNPIRNEFKIEGMCLITAFADLGEKVYEPMKMTYKAIGDYLKWKDYGIVWADGVEEKKAIINNKAIKEAENLGKNLYKK